MMAEPFNPFKQKPIKESKPGVINDINEAYSGAEGDNEISSLESALAGIASGIIKSTRRFCFIRCRTFRFFRHD